MIYAANCGDARAVLGRKAGTKAYRLTHDHKADSPSEISRIESAGGFVLRNRVLGILAVARSLGDQGMKEFVVGRPFLSETVIMDDDEFIIVACDGLWDVMSDQECVSIVKGWSDKVDDETKVAKVAQWLVDEAMKRGSTDNITVIVAWL
jgi:serine/threonine protein phosphatase PrpC